MWDQSQRPGRAVDRANDQEKLPAVAAASSFSFLNGRASNLPPHDKTVGAAPNIANGDDGSSNKIAAPAGRIKSCLRKIAEDGSLPTIVATNLTVVLAMGHTPASFAWAGVAGGLVAYTELKNFKFADPLLNWMVGLKEEFNSNLKLTPGALIQTGLKWLHLNEYAPKEWPMRIALGSASIAAGSIAEILRGIFYTATTLSQSFSRPVRFLIERACSLGSMTKEERIKSISARQ